MAKIFPDSLTPFRFPKAMRIVKRMEMGRIHESSADQADAIAAVPAATDTDTVST